MRLKTILKTVRKLKKKKKNEYTYETIRIFFIKVLALKNSP